MRSTRASRAASPARCAASEGCTSASAPSCTSVPATLRAARTGAAAARTGIVAARRSAAPRPARAPAPGGSPREPGVGVLVGERQHHPRQRDAVRDAVVHPRDEGRAAPVVVDQVEVPERLGAVQRRRHEVRTSSLQLRRAAGVRQASVVEVAVEVELGVVLPVRTTERERGLHRALAEAHEAPHQALLDHAAQARGVERLVEPHDRRDDHEVRRPVHVEPGRVAVGHRLMGVHAVLPGGIAGMLAPGRARDSRSHY